MTAKLYRPGMTYEQFQQALAADPGYQAILHDPANQGPNGLSPQGWIKATQYAGAAGLYDLNAAGPHKMGGAFRSGSSSYGIGGNGEVTEQHESWWNPATAGALLETGLGIYGGGSALGLFGGGTSAGATAGATVPAVSSGGTLASTTTVPLATSTIAGSVPSGLVPAAMAAPSAASAVPALASTTTVPTSTAPELAPLSSSATVPTATGTTAGSVPSGAVPAATSNSSILHTLGRMAVDRGGDMLANAAAGSANERAYENGQNFNATALNNRAMLDAAVFNRDLPSVQTSQVARGDLLSRMKDAPLTGDPRIDKFSGGGLRPSAFGPDTQQAGDALKRQALQNLLNGGGRYTPQVYTPQGASKTEKGLGWASTGLNILKTYRDLGGSF